MAVATPVQVLVAALMGPTGSAVGQSAHMSVAFQITGQWQIEWAIKAHQPNTTALSSGPEIRVYKSYDGGSTYSTVPLPTYSITRRTAGIDIMGLGPLTTGQYVIQLTSGYGCASTWSFAVMTGVAITAIINN